MRLIGINIDFAKPQKVYWYLVDSEGQIAIEFDTRNPMMLNSKSRAAEIQRDFRGAGMELEVREWRV